jgi:heptosyltransferase-2
MAGGTYEVLFIRFSSLGDVLLTTPAVKAVKRSRPESRVTFLTKAAFAPLLRGNPAVDRTVTLPENPKGLADLVRLCRNLGEYDLVVDLHANLRSRVACLALRAKRIVRYRKGSLQRRLWSMGFCRGSMATGEKHVVERYLEALFPLGIRAELSAPEMWVSEEEEAACREKLAGLGLPPERDYAVLVPGARWPKKRWSPIGFIGVGRWLRDVRKTVVVLAGDRGDRELCAEIGRGVGEECFDLSGQTELRELGALLKGAVIAVGNDSGPGHMAAAVGTPVLTLFGPTSESFGFRPLGENAHVLSHDVGCRPCSVHGGSRCPQERRVCLDDIEAGEAIEAMQVILPGIRK